MIRALARVARERLVFLGEAVRSLGQTGAFVPTSGLVAQAVVEPLDRLERPLRVLEVGAGTGALTRAIAARLSPGDRLDAVEINSAFVKVLRDDLARFAERGARSENHPRETSKPPVLDQTLRRGRNPVSLAGVIGPEIRILEGDVLVVASGKRYGAIVSSLPLMNLAPDKVRRIFALYFEVLEPGGVLCFYDYFAKEVRVLLGGAEERRRAREVLSVERSFCTRFDYRKRVIPWNVPPASVHYLWKTLPAAAAST